MFFLLRHLKPVLISIATDKQTTGLGHVTVQDMKKLKVPYPDAPLLDRFAAHVGPLYEAASNNVRQSSALENARDLLLPKFLSGELEVDEGA